MAKPAATTATESTTDTWWDNQKTAGIEIQLAMLHQAQQFFTHTERTISQTRIPGIKLWWTPSGLLGELKGKRELIPATAVSRVIPL